MPKNETIVQECGLGLVRVRRTAGQLAFIAPDLLRLGPVDAAHVNEIADGLRIDCDAILDAQWADNGLGWVVLRLQSRQAVLALDPDYAALGSQMIGVVGPWEPISDGRDAQFEVRAFATGAGVNEDPVTGSLNAALAQLLIGGGHAEATYVASQGTALGRYGRVYVEKIGNDIWIGGVAKTMISGIISF